MRNVVIDTNCLLQIIARGAEYLVSEDSHFKVLHDIAFPQLNLVTLDEFMNTKLIKEFI